MSGLPSAETLVANAAKVVGLVAREDWVVCAKPKTPTETAGGIVLPEISQRQIETAIVVDIGPGAFDSNMGKRLAPEGLMVGAEVVVGRYAGDTPIEFDGVDYLLVKQESIGAVVHRNADQD